MPAYPTWVPIYMTYKLAYMLCLPCLHLCSTRLRLAPLLLHGALLYLEVASKMSATLALVCSIACRQMPHTLPSMEHLLWPCLHYSGAASSQTSLTATQQVGTLPETETYHAHCAARHNRVTMWAELHGLKKQDLLACCDVKISNANYSISITQAPFMQLQHVQCTECWCLLVLCSQLPSEHAWSTDGDT